MAKTGDFVVLPFGKIVGVFQTGKVTVQVLTGVGGSAAEDSELVEFDQRVLRFVAFDAGAHPSPPIVIPPESPGSPENPIVIPGAPSHPIALPPGHADNTLPTSPARPDNTLPGAPPTTDNTLPGGAPGRPDNALPPTASTKPTPPTTPPATPKK